MRRSFFVKATLIALTFFTSAILYSQDTEEVKKEKPVRKPFNANQLIDIQTVVQPKAKSLEMIIHHRFGKFENGLSDLLGIYAPSNIRLGLNYGISDKIMIGLGTEKDGKLQDISWKYAILEQTKSGSMPISLSYYGNMAYDARDETIFGEGGATFTNRLSYNHQLIAARKFGKNLSVLIAPGIAHINKVDSIRQNDVLSVSAGGKYSITKKLTLIAEYDHPLYIKSEESYHELPEPNFGVALEIGTSTHVFQLTCSQYRNIIPQYNAIYNTNAFDDGGWVLGFNINVKF